MTGPGATVALTLSLDSWQRLARLARRSGATEMAVLADALQLYEVMIGRSDAGERFLARDAAGGLQPFCPWLPAPPP